MFVCVCVIHTVKCLLFTSLTSLASDPIEIANWIVAEQLNRPKAFG